LARWMAVMLLLELRKNFGERIIGRRGLFVQL
jgi:hypothetical protein